MPDTVEVLGWWRWITEMEPLHLWAHRWASGGQEWESHAWDTLGSAQNMKETEEIRNVATQGKQGAGREMFRGDLRRNLQGSSLWGTGNLAWESWEKQFSRKRKGQVGMQSTVLESDICHVVRLCCHHYHLASLCFMGGVSRGLLCLPHIVEFLRRPRLRSGPQLNNSQLVLEQLVTASVSALLCGGCAVRWMLWQSTGRESPVSAITDIPDPADFSNDTQQEFFQDYRSLRTALGF